jgi:signal transduction histidine kinase
MPFERTDRLNIGALTISPTQIDANRYQLVSRVVAGLAHEVKNPIHAAIINLELLRRRVDEPKPELLERIDNLEQQVTTIHELIDPLFRFLRPQHGGVDWIDLDDAVGALMPMLRAYCRVARVEISHDPSAGALIVADNAALQQILLNLVVNAVDAMHPDGGRIEVRTIPAEREVFLHVSDTGPGFPDEILARYHEPGATTRSGYAGLGLAISRHLAEEAGGRIEIEEPAAGTGGAHILIALSRAASA